MKKIKSVFSSTTHELDEFAEQALLFAILNKPEYEQFQSETQRMKNDAESQLKSLKSELDRLKSLNIQTFLYAAIGAGALGLIMLFVSFLFGLISVGAAGYCFYRYSREKRNRDENINLKEEEIKAVENDIVKFSSRKLKKSVDKLGRLYYTINILPFEGGHLVIDTTGMKTKSEFAYLDIPSGEILVRQLNERFQELPEELPILLTSNGRSVMTAQEVVTGEESDMRDVLNKANEIFDTSVTISTSLPVYENDDNLVYSIQCHIDGIRSGDLYGQSLRIADKTLDDSLKGLDGMNQDFQAAKAAGSGSVESLMGEVLGRLDSLTVQMKKARDFSLRDMLENQLGRINKLYDYPITNFYNPKVNRTDAYHLSQLPVPITSLADASPIDLMKFHRGEDMVKLKEILAIIEDYARVLTQFAESQSGEAEKKSALQKVDIARQKADAYRVALEVLAKEKPQDDGYDAVQKRNAKLKYNLRQKVWKCKLTEDTFTTEEAMTGRILKLKDTLVLPMWDKLWIEKKDERNRMIREKEQERRSNIEKEISQLREEAKIFTEEYRALRGAQDSALVAGQKADFQLEFMINYYFSQRIISQETRDVLMGRINQGGEQGYKQILAIADKLERELEKQSEYVLIRRGELIDYAEGEKANRTFYRLSETQPKQLTN